MATEKNEGVNVLFLIDSIILFICVSSFSFVVSFKFCKNVLTGSVKLTFEINEELVDVVSNGLNIDKSIIKNNITDNIIIVINIRFCEPPNCFFIFICISIF